MIGKVLLFILIAGTSLVKAQTALENALFGDWSGESKCVGKNQYCHDEVVVYHISRSKTDAKKINISADKIVDGKPDFMGAFDCDYDRDKQTLKSEFRIPRTGGRGVWFFQIDGDKINGTLTIFPENEIGRTIKVTKNKPSLKP
jgi:hypothetical protein